MLHLIPAPLHRVLYRLANFVRAAWWRTFRPVVIGVRVVAVDEVGRVLLVRTSYGPDQWQPPGGGVGRGEEPLVAAARELAEETACTLHDGVCVETREESLHGTRNVVHVIVGRAGGLVRADTREICEVRFFGMEELPQRLSDRAAPHLSRWISDWRAQNSGS